MEAVPLRWALVLNKLSKCSPIARECQIKIPYLAFARCRWALVLNILSKCSPTARECQIKTPYLALARCRWALVLNMFSKCSPTARECQINTPYLALARCRWAAHLQRANARSIHMIWHSHAIGEHLHWSVPKGNTPVLSKVLEC